MLYLAIFTVGYFIGIVTFLFVFPPKVNEISMQEEDALMPLIKEKVEKREENAVEAYKQPAMV